MSADLDDIRARLAAITPGEWEVSYSGLDRYTLFCEGPYGANSEANEQFIAHAPADLRALLDQHDADQARAEALEQERDDLSTALQEVKDDYRATLNDKMRVASERIVALETALREILETCEYSTDDPLDRYLATRTEAIEDIQAIARRALEGGELPE